MFLNNFLMENHTPNKKIFSIKVPARVVNNKNLIEALGGEANIISKLKTNENIDFKFLYNTLPLEKCISNDILIKRKVKRNKKDKNKIKYEYEVIGKINHSYEYFAMQNFIYLTDKNISIDEIKNYTISKEDYNKEIENLKKKNNILNGKFSQTDKINIIHKLEEDINKKLDYDKININELASFFQPNQIANMRNSYMNKFKDLFEEVDLENIN